MRPLGLRAQWAVLSLLLPAFAAAAGLALWRQDKAQAELAASFQRDLGALSLLPRLRDGLRRVDLTTGQFLLSGDARMLDERRSALDDVRGAEQTIEAAADTPEERRLADSLARDLAGLLSQQEQWIARRRAGRLPRAEAARLSSRGGRLQESVALLGRLKDSDRDRLDARRRAVASTSRATLLLIVATGFGVGLLAAVYLARFLVGPVVRLREYARGWRLGDPWALETGRASPEVADLAARLAEMAGRLNVRFGREQELGKLKTQLVAMVSHEFNNALSILDGIAVLLKDDEPKPMDPRREQFYAVIASHVRSLALASRTLLELGRLEAGRLTVRPRRMDLSALASEAARRLQVLWERKKLTLALEVPAEPVWLDADPDALALVTTNLLGNAVKYTPEGGRVTVGVAARDGRAELFVADTGIGIAKEEQARILSGYYRTEEGKKAAKGFGVGLALSEALLQAHGSGLAVASEPGRGARFSFTLPLTARAGG